MSYSGFTIESFVLGVKLGELGEVSGSVLLPRSEGGHDQGDKMHVAREGRGVGVVIVLGVLISRSAERAVGRWA